MCIVVFMKEGECGASVVRFLVSMCVLCEVSHCRLCVLFVVWHTVLDTVTCTWCMQFGIAVQFSLRSVLWNPKWWLVHAGENISHVNEAGAAY